MKYIEFEKALKPYRVFSLKDIQKRFPAFDKRRLYEWQEKGYITKLKRGYYYFSEEEKSEAFLYFAANRIYKPSYISLESALNYYSLIPEGVFVVTSITTKNTMKYETPLGQYEYKHIKPALFFGYRLLKWNDFTVKIAEPEKLILDFFYLKKYNSQEAITELRFNEDMIRRQIDLDKLNRYQTIFNSKNLNKRINKFLTTINA